METSIHDASAAVRHTVQQQMKRNMEMKRQPYTDTAAVYGCMNNAIFEKGFEQDQNKMTEILQK